MAATGATSNAGQNMNSSLEMETEVEIENNEVMDELPQLVVDTATTAEGAKSTGVGSTDSNDSGLAGDHSSPEHDRSFAAGARSGRRRPRGPLKMPPYPGFGWAPQSHQNEAGDYNYDKFSPIGEASIDENLAMDSNSDSHIVYVHINVGEMLSVRVGDDIQQIPGPATVRMVTSRDSGPPAPLPLHVPPGHIVQQIVDEFGTLRHLVLSPQTVLQPSAFPGPFQAVNASNGYLTPTVQFADPHGLSFYEGNIYSVSPVPSNVDESTGVGILDACDVSCISNHEYQTQMKQSPKDSPFGRRPSYKRQFTTPPSAFQMRDTTMDDHFRTVPPRIGGRRRRYGGPSRGTTVNYFSRSYANGDRYSGRSMRIDDRGRNSTKAEGNRYGRPPYENAYNRQSSDNHYKTSFEPLTTEKPTISSTNGACNDDDEFVKMTEMLSRIPPPKVCDIGARSALLKWQPFDCSEASANGGSFPQIDASEFTYEVLVYEHGVGEKPKHIHRCQAELYPQKLLTNLKPSSDYFVRLRASLEERDICGEPSSIVAFRTKPSHPDRPETPDLVKRTKNWFLVTWQETCDNGSQISSYHLEIDDGSSESSGKNEKETFNEIYAGPATQYQIQNLKTNTAYQIRLAASNSCGKSDYSSILLARTSGGPPPEPETPVLHNATAKSLTLQWAKRDCDEEFQLFMDSGKTGFVPLTTTRDVVYTVPNLLPSEDYKFRLTSSNEDGCSPTSEIAVYRTLPPRPHPPSKPAAVGTVSDRVRVAWEGDAVGTTIMLKYALQMKKESSTWNVVFEGAKSEYEVTNLGPGSSYCFRVSCETEGGRSEYSEELQVTTPTVSPGPCNPPSLKEQPKPTTLHLKWSEPVFCGGCEIMEYELAIGHPTITDIATDVVDCVPAANFNDCVIYRGPNKEFAVCSDLQAGCNYAFRVRAYNSVGVGPWSNWFRCQTSAAPPDSPLRLRLMEVTANSVSLEWDSPASNNGSSVIEYILYCACRKGGNVAHSLVAASASGQDVLEQLKADLIDRQQSVDSNASDASDDCVFSSDSTAGTMTEIYSGPGLTYEARSLVPATEYAFSVQAANAAGKSRLSNALFCRTLPDAPEIPKIVKVEPISVSEIAIHWEPAGDNGSFITGYHLEFGPLDTALDMSFPILLRHDCTHYTVENLLPAKAYRFRLRAVNDVGASDFSYPVHAATLSPPPDPPALELASATHNSLKLKWHCGLGDDESIVYTLEMENKAGAFSPLSTDLSTRTYKVTRLCESTQYQFRIRAASIAGGIGPWSETYGFSTLRAPPPPVKHAPRLFDITENSCEIDWQHIKSNSSPANQTEKIFYNLQIRAVPSSLHMCSGGDTFETIYKGPATSFHLTGLISGAAYKIRVCSIRISESGDETESAPSPVSNFSTTSSITETCRADSHQTEALGTKVLATGLSLLRGDGQLSDRHWALLILVAFGLIALFAACILQRFIPEGSTDANGGPDDL